MSETNKKPNNLEELRRLKLAKKELKKKQNAKPQVQPIVPKVYERVFESVPDQVQSTAVVGNIRVMTFNILAQSLIKRELFPDSGDILKWKPRRKMIVDEVQLYDPDIICLQELDNFDSYYEKVFGDIGYKIKYYFHPAKRHGCGIAFKVEKFNVVDYDTIDYNSDKTCIPSYMTGNIAQLAALELKENPNIGFIVGNTHLYWKPWANYERFRQITIYEKRFLEFKERMKSQHDHRWISLFMGDFNSEPIDPGYSILTRKHLEQLELDDLNASRSFINEEDTAQGSAVPAEDDGEAGEIVVNIDDLMTVDQLITTYHKKTLPWKSIYSSFGKINQDESQKGSFGEPKYTNYTSQFQGTLDYMFLEENDRSIKVKRILMLPNVEVLKPSLPNKNFGSDHLCLVADLEF